MVTTRKHSAALSARAGAWGSVKEAASKALLLPEPVIQPTSDQAPPVAVCTCTTLNLLAVALMRKPNEMEEGW